MEVRYPTKPLDCWQRAKELRLEHYKDIVRAKEENRLIITGSAISFQSLLAGIGDFVFLSGEPYGATVGNEPEFALACVEAAEVRGFARDMCAYMRNYWGSMLLDRFFFGGSFPRPDLCFTAHYCDSHGKWYQFVAEHYGIPRFVVETPLSPDPGSRERRVQYLEGQLHEAIHWLEKVTGRRYDDEKLIEAMKNEHRTESLCAQVFVLNQHIPAPLEQKTMLSLYIISLLRRHERAGVDFFRALRDEVEDRVRSGIAAIPVEKCRLVEDSQPPWVLLRLYRYYEQFGAAVVASLNIFHLGGDFWEAEDGILIPPPEQAEKEPRNRDEAVRLMAEWELNKRLRKSTRPPTHHSEDMVKVAQQWHCQGAIILVNRGCERSGLGQLEAQLALRQMGIPTLSLEVSMADPRDLDKPQIFDRVDSFMESLGLKR